MLKGIPNILPPELLKILMEMGHGDTIVIGDGNFPHASIAGDSPLYRQLMPAAERVREITAALNTMFEGIEMDCGSCSMSPVCDEVEDLRRLHQKKAAGKNG